MPSATKEWARKLMSEEEIPEPFRTWIDSRMASYMVYSPLDSWGSRKTNEKLTVLYPDRIVVYEQDQAGLKEQCFSFKEMQATEQGSVLLYSWLTLSGGQGGNAMASVEYNTAVQELFQPFVATIRRSFYASENELNTLDWTPLDFLRYLDYKYWNYAKEVVLPGSKLLKVFYQQQVQEKQWLFWERVLTLAHILLETEYEIIIIRDTQAKEKKLRKEARYGSERIYIPKRSIKKIALSPAPARDILQLSIHLEDRVITLLYTKEQQVGLGELAGVMEQR